MNRTKKNRKEGEVTRSFHFTHLTPYTNGVATNDLDLNALETICLGFQELSDLYRYFCINKLTVTAWVGGTVSSSDEEAFYALYHSPNGTTGATPVLNDVEGKFAVGHAWIYSSVGVPGKNATLALAKDDLTTISKWFVTQNDAAGGADFDGPGVIKFIQPSGVSNTGDIVYDIHFSATFKTMLDPNTISAVAERRALSKMSAKASAKLDKMGDPLPIQAKCRADSRDRPRN